MDSEGSKGDKVEEYRQYYEEEKNSFSSTVKIIENMWNRIIKVEYYKDVV